MNYYHLTADIDDVCSTQSEETASIDNEEEDDDDDPNWLVVSSSSRGSISPQTPSQPEELDPAAVVEEGDHVRLRRRRPPESKTKNNNRLSRLWDGVSTYMTTSPSNEAALPSSSKVNNKTDDDPISQRITEIFDSLQPSELEDVVGATCPRRRPPHPSIARGQRSNPLSRQQRKLHTVSGYFSDWAKWLTSNESNPSSSSSSSSSSSLQQLPSTNNNGYNYTQTHPYYSERSSWV
jgi:hypothetical protein